MTWLPQVIVVLVVLVVAFMIFANAKAKVNPIFLASYRLELKRTGSPEQSLRWAMESFTRRAPFDSLTEADIAYLAKRFAQLPEPLVLAELFHQADENRNVAPLKDRAIVDKTIEKLFRNRDETRPTVSTEQPGAQPGLADQGEAHIPSQFLSASFLKSDRRRYA